MIDLDPLLRIELIQHPTHRQLCQGESFNSCLVIRNLKASSDTRESRSMMPWKWRNRRKSKYPLRRSILDRRSATQSG